MESCGGIFVDFDRCLSGIQKVEAPIAISNVMLWDAKAGAPTKIKRSRENGKLIRVSKKSGEAIK